MNIYIYIYIYIYINSPFNMVVYIENAIFKDIDDEIILQCYQNMQNRRIQLSSIPSSKKDSKDIST
uniref:Uncharacterized protein n=1 Tax=Daucus carota subsp. sativus TaxID=79200 RepID=A0A169WQU2_DAUCS